MRLDLEKFWGRPREDQLKLQAVLAEVGEQKRNPLIGYIPHEKQHRFHCSKEGIRLFAGGNQSGKTTAGLIQDIIDAVDVEVLPERLRSYKRWEPPFHCRIAAPDFVQTVEKVIFEKLREWLPKDQLVGGGWDSAYNKSERKLRFKNGSYFEFLTYEQDRDKWGGSTLHRVHYDEEPPQHLRNEGKARLLRHRGDELFTMTPSLDGAEGWLAEEVWEKRHNPGVFAVRVDMDDNPHLSQEAKDDYLGSLSDEERKARKEGRFIHWAGMVYGEFDDDRHVVDPIDQSHIAGQSIVIGIDPGLRYMAVTFCAFDGDNDMLVFDELYMEEHTVEQAAPKIHSKIEQWGIDRPLIVIDPSARNRNQTNAQNVQAELAIFRIYTQPGQNDVETGVLQIKRRLQRKEPGLLICRNCPRLIWEMDRYKRKETNDGSFAVEKKDDHAVDAMRYAAMERPWLAGADAKRRPKKGYYNGYRPDYTPPWKGERSPKRIQISSHGQNY